MRLSPSLSRMYKNVISAREYYQFQEIEKRERVVDPRDLRHKQGSPLETLFPGWNGLRRDKWAGEKGYGGVEKGRARCCSKQSGDAQ